MTIEQQIAQLSKDMNISELDVKCFAESMVNLMLKDGVTAENVSDYGQELVQAYAKPVYNKFLSFQSIYNTKGEHVFCKHVLALIN